MEFIKPSYTIKFLVLFVCYVITGKVGLEIGAVSGFATLVWLPAGISLAFLLLYGYRLWPAIFLGALSVNLLVGAPLPVALGIGVGNTLEALLGFFILKKVLTFRSSFDRLRDVISLTIIAGPLAAAVSATIGVLSLFFSHIVLPGTILITWITWWTGDVISIFIVSPLLISWIKYPRIVQTPRRIAEIILLMLIVVCSALFVFTNSRPATYLVFPSLIWIALRFGLRETITAVFIVSLIAVIGTSSGYGPFAVGELSGNLFLLQSFMSIVAITSTILAIVVAESKSLERRKDEFINMASHEFRTPLTSIKIYLHILMNRIEIYDDKKADNVLKNINGQIDQLKDLVSDLLDISLIQVRRLQFSMSEFPIGDLISEVRSGLQDTTKQHRILYSDRASHIVYGDRFRITQVLVNFISNAIKYSPKGGDIVIHTSKKKKKLIVSVHDFGIGLSSDQKEKIFDRFYQASYYEERTFPGLGVGLYISKEIIKRHKGNIWVETELGKGSTFYFSLPIVTSIKEQV